jgi:hypothetical protein
MISVCAVCAHKCHKTHNLNPSGFTRKFVCRCGPCLAKNPVDEVATHLVQSEEFFMPSKYNFLRDRSVTDNIKNSSEFAYTNNTHALLCLEADSPVG